MSRSVSDDVLDTTLRRFLAERAADTAGMPSASEVRDLVLARQPRQISVGWRLVPAWQLLVAITLLALASAILLLAGSRRDPIPQAVPNNGRIVISANPVGVGGGENGDLYLLAAGQPRVEHFEPVRIVGADGDGLAQACPSFSPDGRMLAFAVARASGAVTTFRGNWPVSDRAVVVTGVDAGGAPTGASQRFEVASAAGPLACPSWSPDARRLAFRIEDELRIIEIASARVTTIPIAAAASGQNGFQWSRDGSRIAIAEAGRIRVVTIGSDSIVIPTDATGSGGGGPAVVGWTSQDRQIVYGVTDGPGDVLQLRMVDAAGSHDVPLTSIPGAPRVTLDINAMTVSPDGDSVAIAAATITCAADSCATGSTGLSVLGLVTRQETHIEVPEGFGAAGVLWSPDGTRLLLSSNAGVLSVGLAPGGPVTYYSAGELNLEWSTTEVSWQPRY